MINMEKSLKGCCGEILYHFESALITPIIFIIIFNITPSFRVRLDNSSLFSFVMKRQQNQKWLWQWSKTYIADSWLWWCKSYMRNYDWLCNRLQCLPLKRAREKGNYLRLSLLDFFLCLASFVNRKFYKRCAFSPQILQTKTQCFSITPASLHSRGKFSQPQEERKAVAARGCGCNYWGY